MPTSISVKKGIFTNGYGGEFEWFIVENNNDIQKLEPRFHIASKEVWQKHLKKGETVICCPNAFGYLSFCFASKDHSHPSNWVLKNRTDGPIK